MDAPIRKKLNPLTSIRFLAGVTVVAVHMHMRFSGKPQHHEHDWLRWANFVSLYFVLSGFILAYVYSTGRKFGMWRFLAARVVRLWPAHVTSIAIMWLVAPRVVTGKFTMGKLAATLTMTHAWLPFPEYWVSFVPAAWSISTEFGFYLFFPFLIYKWERTWIWKLIASFIFLCVTILLLQAEQTRLTPWTGPYWRFWLYVHPFSRLFEFVLGMSAFQLWRTFASKIKNGLLTATMWECAALFSFLFTLWEAPMWAAQVTKSGVYGSEVIGLWLTAGSACFGGAALLFVLALEQGLMARLLSFSPFVLLGELSYAIYLIHQSILLLFWNHRKDFATVSLWAVFPIIALTILAVAYLIWAVIESPCRYLLSRLWSRSSIKMAIELPASIISPKGVAVRSSSVPIVLPSKRGILIASTVLLLIWALAAFHSRIYS